MPEEKFVRLHWSCKCGVELRIHCEHGGGAGAGHHTVTCPKCGQEHYVPTKVLGLFYREGNDWHHVVRHWE